VYHSQPGRANKRDASSPGTKQSIIVFIFRMTGDLGRGPAARRRNDPADDERCIAMAREFYGLAAPYGLNYRRLAEIKRAYGSANLFRGKPNIKPAKG